MLQICQTLTYPPSEVLTPPTANAHPITDTMYSVVIQMDSPQNDPPELVSNHFDSTEDTDLTVQLKHFDTADDKVVILTLCQQASVQAHS